MIKGFLIYIGILLFTFYWFFMFNDSVTSFMIILETAYFLVSFIYSYFMRKQVMISMDNLIHTAEKNQNVPVWISVENRSKVFPANYRMYFYVENTLTGEKTKFKIMGMADKQSKKKTAVSLSAKNCGNVIITLEKIKVYDLLMLVGWQKKIKETMQVRIVPQMHLFPMEITRKTRDFIAEADEYSDRESGDDPSEVYQIREYNEQDSIHDIHWKLSAKSDTLLVKEKGKPLGSAVFIWINIFDNKKTQKNILSRKNSIITISSDILEIAASISLSLFEEKCPHIMAWYETKNESVRKKKVHKEIHIYELLNYLTLIQPCQDEEKVDLMFKEFLKKEKFSTIIEIKLNGEVFVNKEKIQIPKNKGNIKWDEIIFKV